MQGYPVSLKGANSATNNEFRSSINAKKQDINTVLAQHGPPEFKGSSYIKKPNTWEIIRSGAEPNKVYSLEDTTKSLQHFTVQSYGNGLQSVDIRKVTNRETGAVSTFLDVRVKANATPGQSYEIKAESNLSEDDSRQPILQTAGWEAGTGGIRASRMPSRQS